MRTVMRSVGICAALLAFVASAASAHRLAYPRRDSLRLEPGRLVLTVNHEMEEEGLSLKARFDHDEDGRLSDAEEGLLGAFLSHRIQRAVHVELDGAPLKLVVTSASVEDQPREPGGHDDHLGVVIVLEAPLPATGGVLSVSDVPPQGHRLPLAVVAEHVHLADLSMGRVIDATPSHETVEGITIEATPWRARVVPAAVSR